MTDHPTLCEVCHQPWGGAYLRTGGDRTGHLCQACGDARWGPPMEAARAACEASRDPLASLLAHSPIRVTLAPDEDGVGYRVTTATGVESWGRLFDGAVRMALEMMEGRDEQ